MLNSGKIGVQTGRDRRQEAGGNMEAGGSFLMDYIYVNTLYIQYTYEIRVRVDIEVAV
jgi:hypothetical protein